MKPSLPSLRLLDHSKACSHFTITSLPGSFKIMNISVQIFHTLTPCILLHRTVKLWHDMNLNSILNTPGTNLNDFCASRIYHIPLTNRTPIIITLSPYNLAINKSQKYEVYSESNASMKVCQTSSVTLKWNLSQLLHCSSSFSLLWCTAWLIQWFVLYQVQNGWLVLNHVKWHQTASNYWVFNVQK